VPIPFRGLVAVAEYGSKFEADVAVGALQDAGIDATASYDPALNTVASFMASDRTVEVLVVEGDLAAARRVLDHYQGSVPPAFRDEAMGDWPSRSARRRPRSTAVTLVAVALACVLVGLPLVLILLGLIGRLL
jgi:hypothetical protein